MGEAMAAVARAQDEFDFSCLDRLVSGLRDVRDLLQAMELDAAGVLARKLEQLGLQVGNLPGIREQYRGILVLRRGMEALHGYVDAISRQAAESPLSLAEPINRARDCLGEPPISRFALFNPSIDPARFGPDGPGPARTPSGEIPQGVRSGLIAQIRRQHRRELLGWLTGQSADDDEGGGNTALGRIRVLMEELRSVSTSDSFRLLWWVAGGYLDAVASGEIEVNASVKSLLARLDQEIVRMKSESGSGEEANPGDGAGQPDELLRSMLFELGPLDRSGSERVRDIRGGLGLDDWFRVGTPEISGLARIPPALLELKQSFDDGWFDSLQTLFGRALERGPDDGREAAVDELAQVLEELACRADALGLDSVAGLARAIALTSREACRPDGGEAPSAMEVRVAASILLLRHGVVNPESVDAEWLRAVTGAVGELRGAGIPGENESERAGCIRRAAEFEHRHARLAAMGAIRHDLAGIEASFTGIGAGQHQAEELAAAAGLLQQAGNLLDVLEFGAAARLAHQAAELLSGVAGEPDAASRMNPEDITFVIAALDLAADQLPQDEQAVDGLLSVAAEKLDRARRMLRSPSSTVDAEAGGTDEAGPAVPGIDILDRDLREIFTEEFGRHIETLEQSLDALQGSPPGEAGVEDIIEDIEDCVYTLGDNCRNLGFDEVAAYAEGSLGPLRDAVDGGDLESAGAGYRSGLGLLRSALDEIVARGSYSRELADRLLAGDGAEDGPPEPGEGRQATHSGPAWTAPESADVAEEAIDADILQIFLDESRGILGRINLSLMRWRERGPEQENMAAIRRELHTLKGTAAAAGRDGMSRLIHRVETLLDNYQAQNLSGQSELLGLLEEIHDGLAAELGLLESGDGAHLPGLERRISDFPTVGEARTLEEAQHDPEEPAGSAPDPGSWRSLTPDGGKARGAATAAGPMPGVARGAHHSDLAVLSHASGEMDLVRMQLHNSLDATRMDLELLRISMISIREGLREVETEVCTRLLPGAEEGAGGTDDAPDPERSDRDARLRKQFRELSGRLEQLDRVEQELVRRAAGIDAALEHQRNLGDRLQSGLRSARMVTLGEYFPHLRHLVRETARKAGKEASLEFQGGDIQIDRQVIESMMAPFEHMIRNAVIHGIEEGDERQRSGKDSRGVISISISLQGSELVVGFSDDGRGLAMDRITARAGELGLLDNDGLVSETNALRIITQPGYSTSEELSLEAGRGVGMEIVYQTVRDLGGSMQMTHAPGQGVGFQFRLPVTLAVTPALMVRVGKWRFAFRSRSVERLVRISRDEMHRDGDRWFVEVDGVRVPVVLLQQRLDINADQADPSIVLVVIVRLVDRLAAFEVDEFIDSVDILSRNPGIQLLSIPEISGVTVLSDSSIVLILDPEAFIHRIGSEAEIPLTDRMAAGAGDLRRVLVVDDSAVVRKVMQKDLEADGLEVDTADDGVSALEMLDKHPYDVVLVDIEMPRMNGYELLERLRENPYEPNPVMIVITSGSGEEYRQRALELGADGCITRPYDLAALNRLMRDAVVSRGGPG